MSTSRQGTILFMAVALLALCGMVAAPFAHAEMVPAALLATFKTGTVDAVSASSIRISGMDYRVQSEAKIMDHKGNEIPLEEVFRRSEAKFHLGKTGDIDMMVVMRPQ